MLHTIECLPFLHIGDLYILYSVCFNVQHTERNYVIRFKFNKAT